MKNLENSSQPQAIVTSYPTPDLDGAACIVAYSELLQKQDKDVVGAVFGEPDEEAKLLLDELELEISQAEDFLNKKTDVILTDASFPDGVSDKIDLDQVKEVIDHRKNHKAEKFPNAKVQVELVGAAATLIAEKFRDSDQEISRESAVLVYTAIRDNTVDLKADVTTERDREIVEWLENTKNIDPEITDEVFEQKSPSEENLKEAIISDYYETNHHGRKIGVSQIESLNATELLQQNRKEIQEVLQTLKKESNLDHVFLTSVDIERGKNLIICSDKETENLISKAIGTKFHDSISETDSILLRKQIMPKLRSELK